MDGQKLSAITSVHIACMQQAKTTQAASTYLRDNVIVESKVPPLDMAIYVSARDTFQQRLPQVLESGWCVALADAGRRGISVAG